MHIGRKLLLLVILLLFSFIIFNLITQRIDIIKKKEMESIKEGLSNSDPDYNNVNNEVKKVAIDPNQFPNGISTVFKAIQNKPLMQFCIKGSYNSAYSGNYISDVMVKYVLSRGCRFLDFEIYSDEGQNAIVGYSSDPAAINPTISNKNNVLFFDLLKTTIASAFSNQYGQQYTTTNTDDPLFINIRLKTSSSNMQGLYSAVQLAIQNVYNSGYSQFFYIKKTNNYVNGYTNLKDIMKKVIIIFENRLNFTLPQANISSINSGNFYNMVSNTDSLMKSFYSQINTNKFMGNPPHAINVDTVDLGNNPKFMMVVPDNNVKPPNPSIFSSIQNYGYQLTLFQYYVGDAYLMQYEDMFKTYGSAIVPLSYCLSFINNYSIPSDIDPQVNTVFGGI